MKWSFYIGFGKNNGFGRIKEAMSRLHLGRLTIASGTVDIEDLIENLTNQVDTLREKLEKQKQVHNKYVEGKEREQAFIEDYRQDLASKNSKIETLEEKVTELEADVLSLEVDLDDEMFAKDALNKEKEKLSEDMDSLLIYFRLK